ncbi:malto-oligosyltrehalose synthase [Sporichthya sp.]|uniref:malto-oligosyltrehalose synthase n=1 Tax=Sporichthya sp. TaxID=65475 RepID=UPI00179C958B|nr:malto-oligosyltrehalose synthase [Sporichthya sp.]MBA3743612.1 malto-oligosyltrehalose synthase [Sporichthya sp.]
MLMPGLISSTYRLQLSSAFTFTDAARAVPHIASLGVSHLYLSPILQATPGSTHGYDVVDHTRLADDLGGRDGFTILSAAARVAGLGIVVDVVPNHMALPTPATLNVPLWSVLRDGPGSPYARWFDVDWTVPDRAMLMPLLGRRIGECLSDGEIRVDRSGPEPLVRYFDHVLPVRPGTEALELDALLDRQWYRLAYWRVADEELNYRRFFDIDTLAALRVENDEVFVESHRLLAELVRDGLVQGLRIDHPDGLADPHGYLTRLQDLTGGCWVVVEKILEAEEELPTDWACAGTTGYDALLRAGGVFADPVAGATLSEVWTRLVHGEDSPEPPPDYPAVVEAAKREVLTGSLYAEVVRLTGLLASICHDDIHLRDHTPRGLEESLVELMVAFPVYRAYVHPGEPAPVASVAVLDEATARALERLPEERHATVELVRDLALGRHGRDTRLDEFVVRFQQTTGPVMAKGVEDTAFYRWFPLGFANEVGGLPDRVGVTPAEFHAFCANRQAAWPMAMTTLSTHDTKRGEDVRARLTVLTEIPEEWGRVLTAWRAIAVAYRSPDGFPEPATDYLIWQTLVGAWPLSAERLADYVEKATREAKQHTTWTTPDPAYDAGLRAFVEGVCADENLRAAIEAFVGTIAPHARAIALGQKLVQLTMPGVPDVYQGTEFETLTLVDPDNRRQVDYDARRAALSALDGGAAPKSLDEEKALVTSRALRLRREHPEWFGPEATYTPLETSEHVVGFLRSEKVMTLASRLTVSLERQGGFGDTALSLPPGTWTDVLTGRQRSGIVRYADLLAELPVALLVASG